MLFAIKVLLYLNVFVLLITLIRFNPLFLAHRPKEEPRQKEIVERVIVEKSIGLDLTDVEKLIHEKISQYDADKTGQPDYALESSGGSIVGIGCTKVYEETSRLQSIFGIPLHYATYGPRTVIQVGIFFRKF
jgi:CRISPR/Cas system CMR subunit Cmr6 (Cas7 group RAMP superfamily)